MSNDQAVSDPIAGDPGVSDPGVSERAVSGRTVVTRNAGPGPETLTTLRESLLEQRAFRIEQLSQYGVLDRAERVREQRASGQAEVRVRLMASARMVLADVEAALVRMDEGTYGACMLCARPVPVERLEIVPQARYCLRCQQAREAER